MSILCTRNRTGYVPADGGRRIGQSTRLAGFLRFSGFHATGSAQLVGRLTGVYAELGVSSFLE